MNSLTVRPLSRRFVLAVGASLGLLTATWLLLFLFNGLLPKPSAITQPVIVNKKPTFTVPIQSSRLISVTKNTADQLAKKLTPETRKVPNNKLTLHMLEKEYTFVFSGKVTCGDEPCHTAQLRLHLESRQNPIIVRTVPIQPDGTYEVSILLKEALNEHMDYWITADSPDSAARQIQGREILMEDSTIKIDEAIRLL